MSTIESRIAQSESRLTVGPVPELWAGDHLTRAEFERRYTAMPNLKKAELIEGVVYIPTPASRKHSGPQFNIIGWLGLYRSVTPGIEGNDNGTVRLDGENEPQPDASLRILPQLGGQTRDEDEFIAGSPELIVEIAVSSVSYDLHEKLRAYQRNGVREYIVWRVDDAAIDWFTLRDGRFERLPLDKAGHYRSEIFPGLWLGPSAMLHGDHAQVMAVLQQGIASPEHAAFVAKLAQGNVR